MPRNVKTVGKKHRYTSEARTYLWRNGLWGNLFDKDSVTVRVHNGTTVYQTDNRKAWEARYAKYIDSINQDIKGYIV